MEENEKEIKDFFECMGEIWRDITAIEFLMRVCIAKKQNEIAKFPKPPYIKGDVYQDYPKSFSILLFGEVVGQFSKHFPQITIPQELELVDLRNAMAHGCIARINHSKTDELIKFRKQRDDTLKIEFSMPLEMGRIKQIRQSLRELRRHIALEASDSKNNK